MSADAAIIDQAIDWHLRAAEMDDAGWGAFVAWLEADPEHARAYDEIALGDRLLPYIPEPRLAANDDEPAGRRRWPWLAGAGAAAVAAAVMLAPFALPRAGEPYSITTAAGERRTLALADGTRIELSGGTRLTLDRADARIARLDVGEATFTVHHDAGTPFTLRSGDLSVQDVGTVFNVARNGQQLDIAVAEGAVMFQPGAEGITLAAGRALTARDDTHAVTLASVSPDTVGGWRSGRLSFAGEPLGSVMATIHRHYGTRVTLAGDLSRQPFTGMVAMTGSAAHDIPHMAALIGVGWRRNGNDWILARRSDQAR